MSDDIRILQFGTGRFLLAHADLFISEALDRGDGAGRIALVQTTTSTESAARLAALRQGWRYPVRIRGLEKGQVIDETREGKAIGKALTATTDWAEVRALATSVPIIISNTGDRGYDLDERDGSHLLGDMHGVPKSFPAKLTVLLAHRWHTGIEHPLSLFPCELIEKNGARLRELVVGLAGQWGLPTSFAEWLDRTCRFANSLVDRIVAEPIQPVGAVAEPYALWAIEKQEGLTLPCAHPAIALTTDLSVDERLKLQFLNLGHSYLAERWQRDRRPTGEIVREAIEDPALWTDLEAVWSEEVLPVFVADGLGPLAEAYIASVRDRFLNPFLRHRLADIAENHEAKTLRRMRPVVERAEALGLGIAQRRLRRALAGR